MPVSRTAYLFRGLALLLLTGCGCDTVGYPAVDVTVQDRDTGRPVALGGATLRYENERQAPFERVVSDSDTSSVFSICCTPGNWRVRIAKSGYVPFDSTVRVRSSGQCDRPVLVRLLARLQPLPPSVARSSLPGSAEADAEASAFAGASRGMSRM